MTDDGIPVWGIEEPDIDLGDLVLEDENDALAANRTREMKRSVHAWLWLIYPHENPLSYSSNFSFLNLADTLSPSLVQPKPTFS